MPRAECAALATGAHSVSRSGTLMPDVKNDASYHWRKLPNHPQLTRNRSIEASEGIRFTKF